MNANMIARYLAFCPQDVVDAMRMARISENVKVEPQGDNVHIEVYDPDNRVTVIGNGGLDGMIDWVEWRSAKI